MDLEGFKTWMVERGRDPSTAGAYAYHVQCSLEGPSAPLGRLMDRGLAPKTRHLIKASLRAWARFRQDGKLLARLADFKLPAPRRKAPRKPFTPAELEALQESIDESESLSDPERAVLGIMAVRGLRIGDVLRLTRREVQDALKNDILVYEAKGAKQLEFSSKLFKKYLQYLVDEQGWKRVEDLISPRSGDERRRIAGNVIRRRLKMLGEELDLDSEFLFPHTFRRTVAMAFYEKSGRDLVKLQLFMGWANLDTASLYVNAIERRELEEIWER